jgi:fluoride exporter
MLVGLGGFLGSVARYLTSVSIDQKLNSNFPYGTFSVNIAGAFILGLVYGWASQNQDGASTTRLFLITGFCGGFTTFSAFAFENFNLLTNRFSLISATYTISTIILGVIAVWIGILITKN